MVANLGRVSVGTPLCDGNLSAFPLFCDSQSEIEYLLVDEALAKRRLLVEETTAAGSVSELLARNRGKVRVLFLEGEELVGAKQNRVLNTSLLLGARGQTAIPVSCVEKGRWNYRGQSVSGSRRHAPGRLRYALKDSVWRSLRAGQGHRCDQARVWWEVDRQMRSLGSTSVTQAMTDTFNDQEDRIAPVLERLRYPEGARGVAVAINDRVVLAELFDKPQTCRQVWDRLLSASALDAFEAECRARHAEIGDVERVLAEFQAADWIAVDTVGEGQEYRARTKSGSRCLLLTCEGKLVHASAAFAW